MENLFYTPRDLALIFLEENLTASEEHEILDQFWQNERIFIAPEYRDNRELFSRDLYISKDFEARCKRLTGLKPSYNYMNYYFKHLRYCLFYRDIRFIKCKLRTFLSIFVYGTERSSPSITRKIEIFSIFEKEKRSPSIIREIENHLFFYHLPFYQKGKEDAKLCDYELDDYIVIRQEGK